jgi:presenilin-like A22 family membrane protease
MKPALSERLNSLLILSFSSLTVWILAIVLSFFLRPVHQLLLQLPAEDLNPLNLFLSFSVALIVLVLFRKKQFFSWLIALSLALIIFSGASLFLPLELALVLAAGLFLLERYRHSFLTNNLFLLTALLAGGITVGLRFPVQLLIYVLIFLSVYDVIGVFLTHFIPRIARQSVETNVPLLLLAPGKRISWLAHPHLKNSAAVLGAGDIFMPAIFISAITFNHNSIVAINVLLGAALGILLNTWLAMRIRTGIPAMPLLALCMIVVYWITR